MGTVRHWTRSPTGRARPDRRPRTAHGWDGCDGQIRAQTRPSGLCPDPSGPAMPVTDAAISASECVNAPSAISRATSSDTAPWASGVRAGPPVSAFRHRWNRSRNHTAQLRKIPKVQLVLRRHCRPYSFPPRPCPGHGGKVGCVAHPPMWDACRIRTASAAGTPALTSSGMTPMASLRRPARPTGPGSGMSGARNAMSAVIRAGQGAGISAPACHAPDDRGRMAIHCPATSRMTIPDGS